MANPKVTQSSTQTSRLRNQDLKPLALGPGTRAEYIDRCLELAMDPENPAHDAGEVVACAPPEPGGVVGCGEETGQVLIGVIVMLFGLFWIVVPLAAPRNSVDVGGRDDNGYP
ncbi:hypothetical protein ACP70R_000228 [Stipagrostis hirtigluma subsp. patula]